MKKRTSLWIDADVTETLRREAERRRVPFAWLVREALRREAERIAKKMEAK